MKLAIISDTHAGIRNSSDVFIEYQRRFYEDIFFPYLLEHGINKILHLGDYYESRTSINFKALNANRKHFLDKLREYDIHMDIIPGNHDTFYKNSSKLNALKELLGHYMNEVRIFEQPVVEQYGELKIGMIPWINAENEEAIRLFISTCKADVIGAHLELAGFEMQIGVVAPHGMDHSIFSRFEMVLSGHYHTKSQQDNIHYLGSQMEFFWSDCNDPKYFHILDTETRELTPVQNPITMYEKILYDDSASTSYATVNVQHLDGKFVKLIVINKSKTKEFEKFVDRIHARKHHGLQIVENFSDFVGTNVEDDKVSVEDTESLLYTYIDATDTELDKSRIKTLIRSLMVEAQSTEIE